MSPQPILDSLANTVTDTVGVMQSATVLINGFGARMQTAVDAAIAGGATAEQLAPVQAEVDALAAGKTDLAAAIAANP